MAKKKKFRHDHFLEEPPMALEADGKSTPPEPQAQDIEQASQQEPAGSSPQQEDGEESGVVVDVTPDTPGEAEQTAKAAPKRDETLQTQKVVIAPELDRKRTGGQEYSLLGTRPAGAASPDSPPGTERARKSASGRDDTARIRREELERVRRARALGAGGAASTRPRSQQRVEHLPRRDYGARNRWGFLSFFFGLIGLTFKMIFVTVLVMALAAWLGFMAISWYVKTEETTVPSLRGMRIENALEMAAKKNLAVFLERSEASGLVAPGEIIDQKPLPGVRAKEGTAVRVVVSSGRANFTVPDVVNETRENAINKIKGAGLEVGNITYLDSATVAKDSVISQDPAPGKGEDRPLKVNLLVSTGPRGSSLTMPELTGRSLAEARNALVNLGVTNVTTDPPDASAGRVNAQEPLVGKLILQSQPVVLKVQ